MHGFSFDESVEVGVETGSVGVGYISVDVIGVDVSIDDKVVVGVDVVSVVSVEGHVVVDVDAVVSSILRSTCPLSP